VGCSCTHSVRRVKEPGGHRLRSKENSGVAKYCGIIGEIFRKITIFLAQLHVSSLMLSHLRRIGGEEHPLSDYDINLFLGMSLV